jgi:tellurite resistance protein TerC
MTWAWSGFVLFIILLLLLDLGFLNRRAGAITLSQSLRWSILWVGLGVAFSIAVYDGYAHHRFGLGMTRDPVDWWYNDGLSAASKYLTAYVLEKALSVDNLFVIAVIFRFLAVPPEYQHRVLLWGILGAMVLRGVMIGLGVELIQHYHWVLYILGAFLLVTGLRLLFLAERPSDPSHSPILRIARKLLPLTPHFHGGQFLTVENGRRVFTPLALALLLVETGDAIFAFDSIPAVFGVTADPLLVYTSNIMAILGLRSLYFALAGLLERFRYLKWSLALILVVVGTKMIARHWIHQMAGTYASLYLLGVVALLLGAGIIGSILSPGEEGDAETPEERDAETRRHGDAVK